MASASKRTCLFCDSHDLNREHLWPEWIVNLFPRSSYTGRLTDSTRADVIEWKRQTITAKSRIVCAGCNGGWMSDIESITKPVLTPLILGTPMELSVLDQCALAAGAALRSMVFDTYVANEGRYYTRSILARFKDGPEMSPPANTYIWIAPVKTPHRAAAFYSFKQMHVSGMAGMILTMWVIDQIAFQLVAYRGKHGRRIYHDRLEASGWNDIAMPLWPSPRGNVLWRPRTVLSLQGLQALHGRFLPDRLR